MSKLAVWSSSCFSTLVQVSWPGPCCAVLVFCCFIQSFKFSYQQPAAGLQHGDTDNTPRNSFIHKKILFPSCRYTTNWHRERGMRIDNKGQKALARHLLVQISRKELWPANWARRGKKDSKTISTQKLKYSFQTLIWNILVPMSYIAHCVLVITTRPSPCLSNNCVSVCGSDLCPRSCYEWCPPH